MSVLKHLLLENRKQQVINSALVELPTPTGRVLAVITSETTELSISWWKANEWKTISVCQHAPLEFGPGDKESTLKFKWSPHVQLVGSGNDWYVIFKRRLQGEDQTKFLIQRLLWNENNLTLAINEAPVEIPIQPMGYSHAGFAHFAFYDSVNQKLIVIAQLVRREENEILQPLPDIRIPAIDYRWYDPRIRDLSIPLGEIFPKEFRQGYYKARDLNHVVIDKPELVQLTVSMNTSLYNENSWNWTVIDQGGYDLDAVYQQGQIVCVYRRKPYSAELNVNQLNDAEEPFEIDIEDLIDQQEPLRIAQLELAINEKIIIDGPIGDHPLIQRVNPIVISHENISSGTIRVVPPRIITGGFIGREREIKVKAAVHPMLATMEVKLSELTNIGWRTHSLIKENANVVPRNHGYQSAGNGQWRCVIEGTRIYISSLLRLFPIALIREQTIEFQREKKRSFDVLRHDTELGGLFVNRLLADFSRPIAYFLIDINHSQINRPKILTIDEDDNTTMTIAPENSTFSPFNRMESNAVVDNTIGGALAWLERANPLKAFSYVDMGDGLCRIIAPNNTDIPQELFPFPEKGKSIDHQALLPQIGSNEDWVELTTNEWTTFSMPFFDVMQTYDFSQAPSVSTVGQSVPGSISSVLDVSLDTIIFSFGLDPNLQNTIYENTNQETFSFLRELLEHDSNPDTSAESVPNYWDLIWTPASAFTSFPRARVFDCTLSIGRHRIEYYYRDGASRTRERVIVIPTDSKCDLKFVETPGQGIVDCRIPITFKTNDLSSDLYPLFKVEELDVKFYVQTSYTPCIIGSEMHTKDLLMDQSDNLNPVVEIQIDENGKSVVGLSMKPLNKKSVSEPNARIKISTTWVGAIFVFISILGTYGATLGIAGLTLYVLQLQALYAIFNAAVSSPMGIAIAVAAAAAAAITLIMFVRLPRFLERYISGEIRQHLMSPNTLKSLSDSKIFLYAGEGVAEIIARELFNSMHPVQPLDENGLKGRNRFSPFRWIMILVTKNKLRALIRR